MYSSWKSREGRGVLGFFWQILLRGVLGGCEKIRGGRVLLHFYVEVFQKSLKGYMRCPPPPAPPPVCIYDFDAEVQVCIAILATLPQSYTHPESLFAHNRVDDIRFA